MRVLEVQWSQALSPVCEVAMICLFFIFETEGQKNQRQMHKTKKKNTATSRGGGIPRAQNTEVALIVNVECLAAKAKFQC